MERKKPLDDFIDEGLAGGDDELCSPQDVWAELEEIIAEATHKYTLENSKNLPHFTLHTLNSSLAREVLRVVTLRLQAAGVESSALDARLLIQHVLGVSREELLFSLDLAITPVQYAQLEILVENRAKRRPIAQIIGKREFWGLDFAVSEATLDPRPDSETLIESVLEMVKDRGAALKILDLGTGTGCLLLSLLSELKISEGLGVDISEAALAIAKGNAEKLGLAARADFLLSNWDAELGGNAVQKFNIVISNPPYIPSGEIAGLAPEVSMFEPKLALDGGADGLVCYRSIIKKLLELLAENGFAAFEIGIGQSEGIKEIAAENGLEIVAVKQDLGGIPRCVIMQPIRH